MLGSLPAPGRAATRDDAAKRVAFRHGNTVGVRDIALSRLNGQSAHTPCRRFALFLAEHDARLGGSVTR